MNLKYCLLLVLSVGFFSTCLNAQDESTAIDSTDTIIKNFKAHIVYLADDKLKGRATASKGEELAYEYIIDEFEAIGLSKIKGDDDFLLPFDFYRGLTLGAENVLKLDGQMLELGHQYYPVGQSANKSYTGKIVNVKYGIEADDLGYNNYVKRKKKLKGKAVLIDLSNPAPKNPHSEYAPYNGINYRIEKAIEKGAGAILFYNSDGFANSPDKKYKIKVNRYSIPILFLEKEGYDIFKQKNPKSVTLSVETEELFKTGNNVAAFINNKAASTVVIGGHYDHLGYGGSGSRYTGGVAIHNGADDNASGTAMVIELARWLKKSNLTNYNYMFVAFSGEEMGLYGSKSLVKSANFKASEINYMLNYDMVGRLNEDSVLNINGVGTSSKWSILNNIKIEGIKEVTTTESGMGPSDHASFYLEGIPAVHFFTGAHDDYHKPSDDEEFINYSGLRSIFDYTTELLTKFDNESKIDFKKTKDTNNDTAPKFTVTLGVMPDYVFAGKGMRIDGVSSGKTAFKAGIEDGDIVIKMGDYNVNDMMGYMEALSKFKKGDNTTVIVKRKNEEKAFKVTFE